jgi:hypothetical protein
MKHNKDELELDECVLRHVSSSGSSGLRVTLKPKIDSYNEQTEMHPVMVGFYTCFHFQINLNI